MFELVKGPQPICVKWQVHQLDRVADLTLSKQPEAIQN